MSRTRPLTEKISRHLAWRLSGLTGTCPGAAPEFLSALRAQEPGTPGDHQEELLAYHFITPEQFRSFTIWENDVPVGHVESRHKGNPLLPLYYAHVLLNHYNAFRQPRHLDEAESMLDHVLSIANIQSNGYFLEYHYDYPPFALKAPWTSGLTQALALLLCARLMQLRPEPSLKAHAEQFTLPMLITVADGGSLCKTPEGHPWIEEYPGARRSYVLNGFLFALIALHWGNKSGIKNHMTTDFENALAESLKNYYCGKYLRYDRLTGKFCNPHYMGLQTLLFEDLFALTGSEVYHRIATDLYRKTHWNLYWKSVGRKESRQDLIWLQERFGSSRQ